jgi:hypothetical protein
MNTEPGMSVTARIADAIGAWVSRGGPRWQLLDWMRGYGLPASDTEEPYLWIARGLEAKNAIEPIRDRFCACIKAVLESRPDQGLDPRGADTRSQQRALFNLFMLCSCVRCPSELADPLFTMYNALPASDDSRAGDLLPLPMRELHGLDPRDALRVALVENQVDRRLHAEWRALLERRNSRLPGDAEDGYEGMLRMHPPGRPTEPMTDDILYASVLLLDDILREKDKEIQRSRLSSMNEIAFALYPSQPWDVLQIEELLAQREAALRKRPLLAERLMKILADNKKRGRSRAHDDDRRRFHARLEGIAFVAAACES